MFNRCKKKVTVEMKRAGLKASFRRFTSYRANGFGRSTPPAILTIATFFDLRSTKNRPQPWRGTFAGVAASDPLVVEQDA